MNPRPRSARFRVSDGVELAYLMVAKIARDEGIRALAVKGPAAAEYGLRSSRPVADADILVHPADFERLYRLLRQRGWHPRSGREAPRFLEWHSRTLIHDSWPCDIDLHRYFPGFFGSPEDVFETLWAGRRVRRETSGTVLVPSPAGMAAVVALHAARAPGSERSRQDWAAVAHALRTLFSSAERHEFRDVTRVGRAQWVLRALFADAELGGPEDDATPEQKRIWRKNQLDVAEKSAALWLEELRSARVRRLIPVLLSAIWVPRHDIPRNDPERVPTRAESWAFQKARWRRGLMALRARASASDPARDEATAGSIASPSENRRR